MFFCFRISIFNDFFFTSALHYQHSNYFKYILILKKCKYMQSSKRKVDEQDRGKCLLSDMNKQYCKMTVSILPSPALSLRFVSTWYSSLSRLNKTLSRSPSVDLTQTALSFSPGL